MTTVKQSNILSEICLIRITLIVLLVLYHSFAPFVGAWNPLSGQECVSHSYWWIGKISYACMLETFTFISGYIFGYQVMRKGTQSLGFRNIVVSKFKRLIIPSIVFGAIYLLLFKREDYSLINGTYAVAQGFAHMWYLPMLFWCFIGIYIIEKIHLTARVTLPILLLLAITPMFPLPFQLSASAYYMFFFYLGYAIKRFDNNLSGFFKPKWILASLSLFTAVLISSAILRQAITPPRYTADSKAFSALIAIALKLTQLLYASLGLMFIFLTASYLVHVKHIALSNRVIRLSTYAFGIYLFQQFILIWLYYHTSLQSIIGLHLLPWISFVIVLIGSWLLTGFTLRFKIGRQLIG